MKMFAPSAYQSAIFDWVDYGRGDAVVSAVAGSGKSTTIEEVVARIRSRNTIVFSFNVHIKDHLQRKLADRGVRADVLTIHGYGFRALRRAGYNLGKPNDDKYRALAAARVLADLEPDIARQLLVPKLKLEADKIVRGRIHYLVNLARMARLTLADPDDPAALADLTDKYSLGDAENPAVEGRLWRMLPGLLLNGLERIQSAGEIDFTDMLYGPLKLGARPWPWEWALVDEAQDLSAAQRELVLWGRGRGGRLLAVGDPYQAIMGFAGADADSYREIQRRTSAVELPLSICYRCPQAHIDLAKRIVPHLEARPGAPAGTILLTTEQGYEGSAKEGDLILCRMTAPLIAMCLRLIARKLPARVRGTDIGKALCDLARAVERREPDYRRFLFGLHGYVQDQVAALAQREGTEEKVQRVRDMAEALEVCVLNFAATDVGELCAEVATLFVDDEASIWLSTIHRAKGLEADRVAIVRPEVLPFDHPRMTEEQRAQEWNIYYVALTRAKRELIFCYKEARDIPAEPDVPYIGDKELAYAEA